MLHGIELLKVFANLKKVDRMVNEEIKATRSGDSGDAMVARKEALEYARKESRRQEKIARIGANAAAQAQSFQIQQVAQRNAMLAREANKARRSSRSPAGQRFHGSVRVGKSDIEKLNFMEHAEEIKNKFPREVLASQEKQRELDRNLADRWRQYADEDRRYGHDSMNDFYGSEAPASTPYSPYSSVFEGLPELMEPIDIDSYRIEPLDTIPIDEGGE